MRSLTLLFVALFSLASGRVYLIDRIPAAGVVISQPVLSFAGAICFNITSLAVDRATLTLRLSCNQVEWISALTDFGFVQCNQGDNITGVLFSTQVQQSHTQMGAVIIELRELDPISVQPGLIYTSKEVSVYVYQAPESTGLKPVGMYYPDVSIWAWVSPPNSTFTFQLKPHPFINHTDSVVVYRQADLLCVEDSCSRSPKLLSEPGSLMVIDMSGNLTLLRTGNMTTYEEVEPSIVSVWPYPEATLLSEQGEATIQCTALGKYRVAHVAVPSNPAATSEFYDTYFINTETTIYVDQTKNSALLDCHGADQLAVSFNYSSYEQFAVEKEGFWLNIDVKPYAVVFYNVTYVNLTGTIMHCAGDLDLANAQDTTDDYLVDTNNNLGYYRINLSEEPVSETLDLYILDTVTLSGAGGIDTTDRNVIVTLQPPAGQCIYIDIQTTVTIDDTYKCPGKSFLSYTNFASTDYFYIYVCSEYCTFILSADEDGEELHTPVKLAPIRQAEWGSNVTIPAGVNVYQFPSPKCASMVSVETSAVNGTNAVTSVDYGTDLTYNSEYVARSFVANSTAPVYAAFVSQGYFIAYISDAHDPLVVNGPSTSSVTQKLPGSASSSAVTKPSVFFTIAMMCILLSLQKQTTKH